MSFYADHLLPWLTHGICALPIFAAQRALLLPQANGTVLEVGFGSGLNLPFYPRQGVECLHAVEPAAASLQRARPRIAAAPFAVETHPLGAEAVPLPDASIDTVVLTFTLCTLPDPAAAFAEIRRLLRSGGQLLFCEHGLAPEASIQRWQQRLDPLWSRLAGGCHLNRPIPRLLEEGGFRIDKLDSGYIAPWRPGCYVYRGRAGLL